LSRSTGQPTSPSPENPDRAASPPEVSVIIPTRNRASFLRQALESVLGQTFFRDEGERSFEILVVDDGSTDGTEEAVRSLKGPIRYARQEPRGVSPARNRGLALSRGEFIAFLDSDDLWEPGKIEIQMRHMRAHPEEMVSLTEEIWIRKGVRVNPRNIHRKHSGWVFEKFLPLCLLSLSTALFRREVFDEIGVFDEDLPVCEDYDLGLRLAARYPVHLHPEPLTIKRGGHLDQLSRAFWGMDRYRVRALEKILDAALSEDRKRLVRREIVRRSRILAQGFEKRGKREEAEYYWRLIRTRGEEPGE
jgi:glycosyltransferase involved in cell wall biosynthesis